MFHFPERLPLTFTESRGPYYELHSPNEGKLLTKVQEAEECDIQKLLEETKSIQSLMERLRPYERAAILRRTASLLKEKEEFLAYLIASEGGKPLKDARVETSRAIATIELCAEETLRLEGTVIPMERTPAGKGHLSFTLRDPIGPVLAISAFNHPLNLIAHQVGTAIAAGCTVVLKPAPATPLSASYLRETFLEAGLPEKFLRVVNAPIPVIEKLVSSPEFSFVSFIGSAKVGWELRRKVAPGTRIALEHGGQAPAIVREDADLELAVSALIKGAFYHAGQVCISTQRIFVHETIFKMFLKKFTELASKLVTGSALDERTDVGPLVRPEEVVRLQRWVQEALQEGATLELGNMVLGEKKQYLLPTILSNVPRTCQLMEAEAFGPVVCVNHYQDESELIEHLNSNRYVFEAALFTKDVSRALQIAQELKTMTLVINNHNAFRVDQMPFGGHKESGLGMGGVKYALEELTTIKQVIIKV